MGQRVASLKGKLVCESGAAGGTRGPTEPAGASTAAAALAPAVTGLGQRTARRSVADAPVTARTAGWVPTAGGGPVYSTASSRSWQQPPPGTTLVCIIRSCTNRPSHERLMGEGASSSHSLGQGPHIIHPPQ